MIEKAAWIPAPSAVPERFRSTSVPAWFNEWTRPSQCENKNLAGDARCTNPAEYAITVRDTTGYICGMCVGGCVTANARYGPVTVERLPS